MSSDNTNITNARPPYEGLHHNFAEQMQGLRDEIEQLERFIESEREYHWRYTKMMDERNAITLRAMVALGAKLNESIKPQP